MSIYMHHGRQRSTRFEEAAKHSCCDGIVLSPRAEAPQALQQTVRDARLLGNGKLRVLIDPESYIGGIQARQKGCLPKYAHFKALSSAFLRSSAKTRKLV